MTRLRDFFLTLSFLCCAAPTQAELISGIDFPQGALSFADAVTSYSPGPGPDPAFVEPANALGVPDVNLTNGLACYASPSTANCLFTSLGEGGSLVLQFTDNVLTGSSPSGSVAGIGDGFNDLYVFEVGVAEETSVEISANGTDWYNVGQIGGGGGSIGVYNYGFDIDMLGFGYSDAFSFVRIVDLQTDPGTSPEGADIDAVGAISSVPVPPTVWLLMTGLATLCGWRRYR